MTPTLPMQAVTTYTQTVTVARKKIKILPTGLSGRAEGNRILFHRRRRFTRRNGSPRTVDPAAKGGPSPAHERPAGNLDLTGSRR